MSLKCVCVCGGANNNRRDSCRYKEYVSCSWGTVLSFLEQKWQETALFSAGNSESSERTETSFLTAHLNYVPFGMVCWRFVLNFETVSKLMSNSMSFRVLMFSALAFASAWNFFVISYCLLSFKNIPTLHQQHSSPIGRHLSCHNFYLRNFVYLFFVTDHFIEDVRDMWTSLLHFFHFSLKGEQWNDVVCTQFFFESVFIGQETPVQMFVY